MLALFCLGVYWGLVTPILFAWWLSLKCADNLVTAKILECEEVVLGTSLSDSSWETVVNPAVYHLADTVMVQLSQGYSDGLAVLWAMYVA